MVIDIFEKTNGALAVGDIEKAEALLEESATKKILTIENQAVLALPAS